MKQKQHIVALPGFLGLPSDWKSLESDYFKPFDLNELECNHLYDWANQFNTLAKDRYLHPILMGYSFGGRLALHALIQNPHLWKAGIIISAHPGLKNPIEKSDRLKSDQAWANRFLEDDWDTLMQDWNGRQVFAGGSFVFQRKEEDYNRKDLAGHLKNGSLGLQEDLREAISALSIPLLWIVGENDRKFVSLAESLKFKNPLSKLVIIPQAGHRAPWDNASVFIRLVNEFLVSLDGEAMLK